MLLLYLPNAARIYFTVLIRANLRDISQFRV